MTAFPIPTSHPISFTGAQGIPTYNIRLGRGKVEVFGGTWAPGWGRFGIMGGRASLPLCWPLTIPNNCGGGWGWGWGRGDQEGNSFLVEQGCFTHTSHLHRWSLLLDLRVCSLAQARFAQGPQVGEMLRDAGLCPQACTVGVPNCRLCVPGNSWR